MPTDDQQVFVVGQADAPAGFLIPGNGQIKPKAMNAIFDGTNAAGDFLPALEIVSDAGIVVARVAASTVTMGNSAEVTWAPFLEAPASAGISGIRPTTVVLASRTQTITSGVVTAINFTAFTYGPGAFQAFVSPSFSGWTSLVWANPGVVTATLIVDWPAAAYDRYIEGAIANPSDANYTNSPRVRQSVTPDGDRLTLSAIFSGGAGPPATTLTFNVFQASGVNRSVKAQLYVQAIPTLTF